MKIVIIEDEPATARNLAYLVTKTEPAAMVDTFLATVSDSVAWLRQNTCDLIFMDIRLADGLSFDIFKQVSIETPIIFVTAYNDYALQAFKSNGIDYILKPVDEQELAHALVKYKRLNTSTQQQRVNLLQLSKMLQTLPMAAREFRQSFLVHLRDKLIPVNVGNIAWFYTTEETSYLHTTTSQEYIIEHTLEQLQLQLDPSTFYRVNRQFIINRKSIVELSYFFNGRLLVKVEPNPKEQILVSKARASEFKNWMNA